MSASGLGSAAPATCIVAREKGRRTLADEAATIAAINAKIDAMRARAKESEAAIRQARKAMANNAGARGKG